MKRCTITGTDSEEFWTCAEAKLELFGARVTLTLVDAVEDRAHALEPPPLDTSTRRIEMLLASTDRVTVEEVDA